MGSAASKYPYMYQEQSQIRYRWHIPGPQKPPISCTVCVKLPAKQGPTIYHKHKMDFGRPTENSHLNTRKRQAAMNKNAQVMTIR